MLAFVLVPRIDIQFTIESSLAHDPQRLDFAIRAGFSADDIQAIIEENPELVNMPASDGSMPLHTAIHESRYNLISKLMEMGAEIDAQSVDGTKTTALEMAIFQEKVQAVEILLRYGADPYVVGKHGETAFDVADRLHRREISEMLQRYRK